MAWITIHDGNAQVHRSLTELTAHATGLSGVGLFGPLGLERAHELVRSDVDPGAEQLEVAAWRAFCETVGTWGVQ